MYRYQIKKGAEERVFTNARRISVNVLESDEPLNSAYLDMIEEKEQVPNPSVNSTPVAPPVSPPNNPDLSAQGNEQTANKESN